MSNLHRHDSCFQTRRRFNSEQARMEPPAAPSVRPVVNPAKSGDQPLRSPKSIMGLSTSPAQSAGSRPRLT